jgi:hypothetical protein
MQPGDTGSSEGVSTKAWSCSGILGHDDRAELTEVPGDDDPRFGDRLYPEAGWIPDSEPATEATMPFLVMQHAGQSGVEAGLRSLRPPLQPGQGPPIIEGGAVVGALPHGRPDEQRELPPRYGPNDWWRPLVAPRRRPDGRRGRMKCLGGRWDLIVDEVTAGQVVDVLQQLASLHRGARIVRQDSSSDTVHPEKRQGRAYKVGSAVRQPAQIVASSRDGHGGVSVVTAGPRVELVVARASRHLRRHRECRPDHRSRELAGTARPSHKVDGCGRVACLHGSAGQGIGVGAGSCGSEV